MPIIGVDRSGHVRSPPIYFVASRKTGKKGQRVKLVKISVRKHDEYIQLVQKMKLSHWSEKVSAVLIFKTIIGIYYAHDSINIDTDFEGKARKRVREYLRRLFLDKFVGDSKRNNPSITFVSSRVDDHVSDADTKSKTAKDIGKAPIEIQRLWTISKNPKINREINALK